MITVNKLITSSNMKSSLPSFIITVDTEGDNLWAAPKKITTKNAHFLPRFQQLCEKYEFKPTYLTNYEMVVSEQYQKFAFDILDRKVGEIGMHLHAWNSPPICKLTKDDYSYRPYLIEYPENIMYEKISYLTDLLENVFGKKMTSHRAGRWAINERYMELLIDFGYKIDCSVTPHIYWKGNVGEQIVDLDYTKFPTYAYFPDLKNISNKVNGSFLEVPMTIVPLKHKMIDNLRYLIKKNSLPHKALDYLFPENIWLRPNGRNLFKMLSIIDKSIHEKWPYVMFMIHSSELMPRGSPTFKTEASIEKLFKDIEILFNYSCLKFRSMTLEEYYVNCKKGEEDGL